MKKLLLFYAMAFFVMVMFTLNHVEGQTVVFSENFSGFTTGNHQTPSTSDCSASLDTRTLTSGWTGSKVYSAGGEIKMGTSEITGWIETPLISFSGYEESLILKFDVCRWTGDETSVKVLLNGSQIGTTLTPGDEFMSVEIPVTPGISTGKIRFEAITKRFFLDNVLIEQQIINGTIDFKVNSGTVTVFPNPVRDYITLTNTGRFKMLNIYDITGKPVSEMVLSDEEYTTIQMAGFPEGIYIFRLSSGKYQRSVRVIKFR